MPHTRPDHSRLVLTTPEGAPFRFTATIDGTGPHETARALTMEGPAPSGPSQLRHRLQQTGHPDYLDMFEALAGMFDLPLPVSRRPIDLPPPQRALRPLLTEPVSPGILYGYGDPSVLRVVEDGKPVWYLLVTSNDAPNAFPILRSEDAADWRHIGFVFPEGAAPAWTLTGPNLGDFWAPEMHRVGEEYWVVFTARQGDHSLAIGLARSASPAGPFVGAERPLLGGGVIDSHIVVRDGAPPLLVWKVDANDRWPRLLAAMLHDRPGLISPLFSDPRDQRTVGLLQALWPWVRTLEPMEQFFLQQPMIEAVTGDFAAFRARLTEHGEAAEAEPILSAMRTRIYAQPVAPDGSALLGEPTLVLENDQAWEAHLIEGAWIFEAGGHHHLLYAGNDFSTPDYGIGAAVAEGPLGPYRKQDQPLLRSTTAWWGPGHPSVAVGPDGRRHMFLHAFRPGEAGYKAFRALLSAPLRIDGERLSLDETA